METEGGSQLFETQKREAFPLLSLGHAQITRYVKGVPFVNRRYMKGGPFLGKWYIKG